MNKSFFLDQHGCAKNQVDGELLISQLLAAGWTAAGLPEDAAVIIINSCGFIESAKKESLDAVLDARRAYPNAKILLAGCLAERYASLFQTELPEADGIFGNGDLSRIAQTVESLIDGERALCRPPQTGVSIGDRPQLLGFPGSAFVKITEGCDNCCSFCAIPIIRGRMRSRTDEDILDEIKKLLSRGIFEINLVAQDLAVYGTDTISTSAHSRPAQSAGAQNAAELTAAGKTSAAPNANGENVPCENQSASGLSRLLKKISALSGDFWIRLLYIHPDHFPLDILPLIAADRRILPYFDIPFQSGDNNIIRAMNRVGPAQSYLDLISKIRLSFPDGSAVRTTFLCGFPGESDEAAINTLNFLKSAAPDWSGCFTYSKEEDTPAYSFKKSVSAKKAAQRADALNAVQQDITAHSLMQHVGKTYTVLIEEIVPDAEKTEGIAIGRAWFQAPEVDGAVVVRYELDDEKACRLIQPGNRVPVTIQSVSAVDLSGVFSGS